MRRAFALLLCACALSASAFGSSLSISGTITQSTQDGTGPAQFDPSLNNILDGQAFTLSLMPPTPINGPGSFDLTGSALSFFVPAAGVTVNHFGAISLTVTADGSFDDVSLLACIAGADCLTGNALSANFQVPAASFGGTGVPVTGLDQPHPVELLEDDGTTDLHASVLTYSNPGATVTPEPSSGSLCAIALLAALLLRSTRS